MSVKVPYLEHMGTGISILSRILLKEPFVSFRFDVFLSMNLEAQIFSERGVCFQEHVLSLDIFKVDFLHSTMVKHR